ncbi:MAG: tetratricopeptide repeat protein [Thermoguttaceae bacterium]
MSQYNQGKYNEALQTFQSAILANPDDADAYYNIAALHHRLGQINKDASQYAQAEQYYIQCLNKNPNHIAAYRGFAVWFAELGQSEKAFQLLKNWEILNPTLANPKIELARLNFELGRKQEAIDYLAAAVAAEPKNTRALNALGYIRESNNDVEQAVANYKKSLQSQPYQDNVSKRLSVLESPLVY